MQDAQTTIEWLLGDEAAKLRIGRGDAYVAHIETQSCVFVELGAESPTHARGIILDWLKRGAAMTGAVRMVKPDGKLSKIIGPIEWDAPHDVRF